MRSTSCLFADVFHLRPYCTNPVQTFSFTGAFWQLWNEFNLVWFWYRRFVWSTFRTLIDFATRSLSHKSVYITENIIKGCKFCLKRFSMWRIFNDRDIKFLIHYSVHSVNRRSVSAAMTVISLRTELEPTPEIPSTPNSSHWTWWYCHKI